MNSPTNILSPTMSDSETTEVVENEEEVEEVVEVVEEVVEIIEVTEEENEDDTKDDAKDDGGVEDDGKEDGVEGKEEIKGEGGEEGKEGKETEEKTEESNVSIDPDVISYFGKRKRRNNPRLEWQVSPKKRKMTTVPTTPTWSYLIVCTACCGRTNRHQPKKVLTIGVKFWRHQSSPGLVPSASCVLIFPPTVPNYTERLSTSRIFSSPNWLPMVRWMVRVA